MKSSKEDYKLNSKIEVKEKENRKKEEKLTKIEKNIEKDSNIVII